MKKMMRIKMIRWISRVLPVVFLAVLACAPARRETKDPFQEKWKAKAEISRGYSPSISREVVDLTDEGTKSSLMNEPKPESAPVPRRELPKTKVTLKMTDTDLRAILRGLARSVNVNILFNEGIKGTASINVKEVEWDQLFLGILKAHHLTHVWEGDLIRILTTDDMEADLKREAQKLEYDAQEHQARLIGPLITRMVRVDYADPQMLKTNLENFLTKDKEGNPIGAIMVDTHNNALIVQALGDDMDRLVALLNELDKPTRQILLEAHIVETTKDTARNLGIQWGGLYHKNTSGDNYWITPGANSAGVLGQSLAGTGIDPASGMASSFPADLTKATIPGSGLTLGYVAEAVGDSVLNVQLSALQEDGKLNILSNPSITTVDNQAAIIESGTEVPYQTIEEGQVQIEWKKAVLRLEVEPHVIDDNTIKLKIKTSKDELDFNRSVQGNPTIITKKAETGIVLLDGQTTVIGGLNKEKTSGSEYGVPFLKDIPFIGALFRGRSSSNSMEDVLIFITPYILKEKLPEDMSIGGDLSLNK